MLPCAVRCDECGRKAVVRGYGRLEYVWGETSHTADSVQIKSVRVTVDCPRCGVHTQDHHPANHIAT
jgi:hypothetical protein